MNFGDTNPELTRILGRSHSCGKAYAVSRVAYKVIGNGGTYDYSAKCPCGHSIDFSVTNADVNALKHNTNAGRRALFRRKFDEKANAPLVVKTS